MTELDKIRQYARFSATGAYSYGLYLDSYTGYIPNTLFLDMPGLESVRFGKNCKWDVSIFEVPNKLDRVIIHLPTDVNTDLGSLFLSKTITLLKIIGGKVGYIYAPNIEILTLQNLEYGNIYAPKAHKLIIINCKYMGNDANTMHLQNIKTLVMSEMYEESILKCVSPTHIAFEDLDIPNSKYIKNIINLDINNCTFDEDIFKNTSLTVLKICKCDTDCLTFDNLTSVKKLELYDLTGMNDVSDSLYKLANLEDFRFKGPSINLLSMTNLVQVQLTCTNIKNEDFCNMKKLKKIILLSCPNITIDVFGLFPNIKSIHTSKCGQIKKTDHLKILKIFGGNGLESFTTF